MTPKTALITVVLWSIVFTVVGSAIGATIGAVAPDYYRSLFRGGHLHDFSSLQVGIGLGATQGAAAGIAISIELKKQSIGCGARGQHRNLAALSLRPASGAS